MPQLRQLDARFIATIVGLGMTVATLLWNASAWQAKATMRLDGLHEEIQRVAAHNDKEDVTTQAATTAIANQLNLIKEVQREVERTIRIEEFYHGPAHPVLSGTTP